MAESSPSPDAPLARAMALAVGALAEVPAGLLTDFDGTISPIVDDPALAALVDGASGALAALVDRLAVVAVVTGRAPLDARRMTGVGGMLIAGNHGTEWLEPDSARPLPTPATSSVRAELDAALGRLPNIAGMLVEHKGLSATVHYRKVADPASALPVILEALGDMGARGLDVRQGRMSVELRPRGHGDKGTAARAIIERFSLRGVLVMGDDITDLDMFRAVTELRTAGRVRGAIVAVGGRGEAVPEPVAEASDVILADPAEAAALLAGLARD